MNRLIVAIGLLVTADFHAFAQGIGIFEFMNVGVTDDRQVYVGDFLTGPKASGNGYQIAIFWGPSGTTDENALVQAGAPTGFLTDSGAGQFSGGGRTLFGLSENGGVIALQARAWDASTGATWAEAAANPAGRIGKNQIFEMATRDPNDLMAETPRVGYDLGWRGFAIAVPEPSTWGIALVGVGALFLLRRRR